MNECPKEEINRYPLEINNEIIGEEITEECDYDNEGNEVEKGRDDSSIEENVPKQNKRAPGRPKIIRTGRPGSSRRQLEERARIIGIRLENWARTHKLEINTDKTVTMMLKGSIKGRRLPVDIAGRRVNGCTQLSYLGVHISEGFRLAGHVRWAARAAGDAFGGLRRGVFEAIATYAAPVWYEWLNAETRRMTMLRAQRTALLLITRAYRTVSHAALQVLAGTPPIDLLVRWRARAYFLRRELETDIVMDSLTEDWQRQWRSSPHGRTTYCVWPSVSVRLQQKKLNLDYYLTQALTGHGRFGTHQLRFGFAERSTCFICGEPEDDVEHALIWCEGADVSVFPAGERPTSCLELWQMLRDQDRQRLAERHVRAVMRRREDLARARHEALQHRQLRNKYVGLLRKTKADNWRTTATEAATKNTWGIVYQLARDKLRYKTLASAVEGVDGERVCEDSAKAVLQKFLPEDDPTEDTTEQKEIRRYAEEPADELQEDQETFDLDEVKRALWRMAPRKAPGRDGVTAAVLRAAWASAGAAMTNIYNFSYRQGVFPTCWTQGEMRLIPKKDGGSRPLTLLPVAGKVYEHLLRDRIDKHLDEKSPISQRQYGFRAGRSTTDAIMEMVKYVRTSPDTYVCALFLDIQGAFDNAWWPLVLHRLRRSGCPRNLYEVVRDYFRCRTTHITGNEFVVSRRASRGCPQGSVLGPTFWNIVMDTFLEVSFRFPHLSIAYADDGLILFSGNSRNELVRRADEIGDALTKWSRGCKLRICNKKTHTMMLKGKFKAGRQPLQLRINGERIRMASSTVYLGVTIDEGLSFQRHLRETATAARDALRCIRRYSGTAWGFSYRDQWRIYKAFFEGIITYAAPVWAPLLAADRYLKIVNRSQRNALLLITKAFRTVSTEALQVVAGAMPMDILLRQREALYHHRRGDGNPTDTEKSIRERFTAEWQQRWTSTPKGRHTFRIWPNAYTGHGRFNAKLHEHGIVGDSTCAICGCEEDTVEHALWECPPTTRHRRLLENEIDNDTYAAALRNPRTSQQIQQYIQAVLQSRERTGRYSRRAELTRRRMR
ncbi:UNVERIFIED_CONTAM: hypothetical protein PYX00_010805 [Menopon gallinae]|uniref:Reverse transcriptase domain-containing protein n=1 Tax=Menopon gallinae TaxID=328185 RepID=A0AAW2HGP8_9NEOP